MKRKSMIPVLAALVVAFPSGSTAQSPDPSPARLAPASIVGEWVGIHDCESIVAMLGGAGLDEFVLEQIWGNGLLPGATSDADIADPTDPCAGTIPRAHSHFFTADGRFGSRDYAGQPVDDGRYALLPDDVVEINGARFHYLVDGDSLTLMPEPPDISSCTDKECRFPAAWVLMVALPGSIWTRSTSVAVSSPEPGSAPAESSAITDLEGRVLFTRAGGSYGDETVFLIDADRSDERQITDFDGGCCIWALRDGSLMFRATVGPDDRQAPTISSIDGTDGRVIPSPDDRQFGSGPLSPDGSRVVLEGFDAEMNGIGVHIANVDGTGLEALTEEPFIPGDFSPDGREVLLWKFEQGVGDSPPIGSLWLVGADGSDLRQLTPDGVPVQCCFNFRWSPDGTRIIFASPEGGLWTIGPDGAGLTEIFHDPDRWAITPTWSPDGSMIMFALDPSANPWAHPANELYVIREDGSDLTLFLGGADFKREPVWIE